MRRLSFVVGGLFVLFSITLAARQSTTRFADHFVVQYGGNEQTFRATVQSVGGTVDRIHPAVRLAKVSGLTDAQAAQLAAMPGIVFATRDVIVQWVRPDLYRGPGPSSALMAAEPQSHDPTTAAFFPLQWNMRIINADDAWNADPPFSGSPNVRVAVIDSGIDPFHIDLIGRVDATRSIAIRNSTNPAGPVWGDDHFHGTFIAGTISSNGVGTSGVAPHTTLIAVKILDANAFGTFADLIAGLIHSADVGADVINLSLGQAIPVNTPGFGFLIGAVNAAMNYAASSGALIVSAAGNNKADLTFLGSLMAMPCESGAGMCVSATGPTDLLARYSNFGQPIDLAAPGGDFAVTGVLATSTVLAPCSSLSVVLSCGPLTYLFVEGTSAATPHVSGAAALLDAQHGGRLNGAQLKAILQGTADDLGRRGADPIYGRGRLNVLAALTR